MAPDYIQRRQVKLYMTPEETEHLETLARHFGITKSQAIRAAIERMYREEIAGPPPGGTPGRSGILDQRI